MNANDFRRLGLSLQGAEEGSHMGRPDWCSRRILSKICLTFSSLLLADGDEWE